MINHYYTLKKVTESLDSLIGCIVIDCFSQEKDTLVIAFSDRSSVQFIQFCLESKHTTFFLRDEYQRARKNSINLFDDLTEDVLQNVSIAENNRVVRFEFLNSVFYAEFFGGGSNNLILCNSEGYIIDSFKNSKSLISQKYTESTSNLPDLNSLEPSTPIVKAIAKSNLLLGNTYAQEFCLIQKLDAKKPLADFSQVELKKILDLAVQFRADCLNSDSYYLYSIESTGFLFSLISLSDQMGQATVYTNISDAIRKRIISGFVKNSFLSEYERIKKLYTKELSRLNNTYNRIYSIDKLQQLQHQYMSNANILLSQPQLRNEHKDFIILQDFDGKEVKITLNKKKSIRENYEDFFAQAKKLKTQIEYNKKLKPQVEGKIKVINSKIQKLSEIKTMKELKQFIDESEYTLDEKAGKTDEAGSKFRNFDLGDGFILYVGKNAKSNDELTMRFAKPNDLWFHARGAGGSHCVLKINKGQKPNKPIIKKAAEIAAYYSKSKNAKYTPVAYTFKKYVRKPKGANAGTVTLEREEVIMVEPKLPQGTDI